MPPFPGLYNSTFTAGGVPCGFDVRGEGGSYQAPVEANQTVESIPWAQTYSVVRHYAGIKPLTRQYRALVYTTEDMIALAIRVGATGTLLTPRQQSVTASLDKIDPWGDYDRSVPDGALSILLSFTLLE